MTRRHVDHLDELTKSEVASAAQASRVIAKELRAEGAERVHVAVNGLGVAHFHQHLYPRYPGVPADTSWMAAGDLPDDPHGDADEIAAFVTRIRGRIARGIRLRPLQRDLEVNVEHDQQVLHLNTGALSLADATEAVIAWVTQTG